MIDGVVDPLAIPACPNPKRFMELAQAVFRLVQVVNIFLADRAIRVRLEIHRASGRIRTRIASVTIYALEEHIGTLACSSPARIRTWIVAVNSRLSYR